MKMVGLCLPKNGKSKLQYVMAEVVTGQGKTRLGFAFDTKKSVGFIFHRTVKITCLRSRSGSSGCSFLLDKILFCAIIGYEV